MKFLVCFVVSSLLLLANCSAKQLESPHVQKRVVCGGVCIAIGTAAATAATQKAIDAIFDLFRRDLPADIAVHRRLLEENDSKKVKRILYDVPHRLIWDKLAELNNPELAKNYLSRYTRGLPRQSESNANLEARGLGLSVEAIQEALHKASNSPAAQALIGGVLDGFRGIFDKLEKDQPELVSLLENGYNEAKTLIESSMA